VQNWIETIIEEKFPDVLYEDALKNGVILCKYVFLILNVENVQSQWWIDWWINFNRIPFRNMQHRVEISNFVKIFHFFVCTLFLFFEIDEFSWLNLENAARAYGLEDTELFQSIDLFEKRNIPQVTQCLLAVGRQVYHEYTSSFIYFYL